MKSYRNWWAVYAGCCALLVLATAWITFTLLQLESREARLHAVAAVQEDMRLALWRMDSGNDSFVAAESSRPFFHYRSYYPHQRAYTRLLEAFGPDDLLVPSPLLGHASGVVVLHIQREADGSWSSPQVPTGNLRDLAEANGIGGLDIDAHAALLAQVAMALNRPTAIVGEPPASFTRNSVARSQQLVAMVALTDDHAGQTASPKQAPGLHGGSAETQTLVGVDLVDERSIQEQEARGRWLDNNQALAIEQVKGQYSAIVGASTNVDVTAFVSQWIEVPQPLLVFMRDVTVGETTHEQGFVVDFEVLAGQLLTDIGDLFPAAGLRPVKPGQSMRGSEASRLLTTLPAVLEVGRLPQVVAAGLTPMRLALLMAWIAVLVVIVAVGFTLRSIIAYAQRRTRFASAVTHELRTPLTTFQLYAELLDEGVVTDEATQREYHKTLRRESARLGRLVENVLAYARLEDGRHVTQRASIGVDALVEDVLPALRDRASAVGITLNGPCDRLGADAALSTSPGIVEQILGNLVDNACKYGQSPISLKASLVGNWVVLDVQDAGDGVHWDLAERIFEPFDRGVRQDGDPSAGVGLGLALSRELAHDIGGTLTLRSGSPTTFRLALPMSQ
jgi:signal transduction histidine kinase